MRRQKTAAESATTMLVRHPDAELGDGLVDETIAGSRRREESPPGRGEGNSVLVLGNEAEVTIARPRGEIMRLIRRTLKLLEREPGAIPVEGSQGGASEQILPSGPSRSCHAPRLVTHHPLSR